MAAAVRARAASSAAACRLLRITGVAVAVTCYAAAVDAQTVLVRTAFLPPAGCTASGCPTAVFAYDPDGRALLDSTPTTGGPGAYVTPDGALLVGLDGGGTRLVLLNRTSGAETLLPLAAVANAVIGNPTRLEIYLNDGSTGLALAPSGSRPLATPTCQSPTVMSVSADGRRVVYLCFPGNGNPGYSAVIDTASGALVKALPFGWTPVLNADGSALFQTEADPAGTVLRRYNADSGALDTEAVIASSFITPVMAFDPRSSRVFLWAASDSGVFDAATLAKQTSAGCASVVSAMAFSRDRSRAFLVGLNVVPGGFGFDDGVFCEIDTASLVVTASYRYGKPQQGELAITLAEVPRPPAALVRQVSGSSVSLTWQPGGPPAAITRYVLEVGSAPGLSDIFTGLDVGLQTSFAAGNVPPGTYYVRVRAGNYSGLGAPSNEVTVVVP